MTSSLRGLAACTALLVLLGLAWVLGLGAPRAPLSPQLGAPRPESVQAVRWLRDGEERMGVQREGAGWSAKVGAARALPAKARVIDDVLDVLAAASWHRRDAAVRAGAIREQVVLSGAAGRSGRSAELAIGLGAALGDQRWLVIADRALLVDGWVARVLEKAPDELLDLAVLPDAARSPTLEVHRSGAAPWQSEALVLQGVARVSPSRARLDESLARELRDQLSALQLAPAAASDGDEASGSAPLWSVRIAGGPRGEATITGLAGPAGAGPCPGGARVASSRLGTGCLGDDALRALAALIDRAASPSGVDARPLAAAPQDVVEWTVTALPGAAAGAPLGSSSSVGAVRLVRRGASGWDGERDGTPFSVEPAAAAQLLELFASPWSIASGGAQPRSPAALSLAARHRDGTTVSLALHPGAAGALVAVREGEPLSLSSPVPLVVSPPALATALASLTLWQLEPTSIARVALGGQTLVRGAVIGEWLDARGQPIAAARAAALDELLGQLSSLRALSRRQGQRQAPSPAAPRYRLSLWLDAAPARVAADAGAPATNQRTYDHPPAHTLELSLTRGECAGRADGEGGVFSPELCAQLAALVP